jgi:hypothetical protein
LRCTDAAGTSGSRNISWQIELAAAEAWKGRPHPAGQVERDQRWRVDEAVVQLCHVVAALLQLAGRQSGDVRLVVPDG